MRNAARGGVLRRLATTVSLFALPSGTPACGMLSAITNPGAAFALNEPAPMSIVVRRAEVANATAHQIERVIGEAAFGAKAKWVDRVTIAKADAEAMLKTAGADPIYAMTQTRVMPAEAWLIALSGVCDKDDEHSSLMAALSDEADEKYAGDLASYLLFDGTFAKKLIELGRADAEARRFFVRFVTGEEKV